MDGLTLLWLALTAAACLTRQDAVPRAILLMLLLSIPAGMFFPPSWLVGVIGSFDGLLALAMLWIVTRCLSAGQCVWCDRARRAQFVGLVAVGKIILSFVLAGSAGVALSWQNYALLINVGFVLQVAAAGGWLNGVGVFSYRLWRGLGRGPVVGAVDRGDT